MLRLYIVRVSFWFIVRVSFWFIVLAGDASMRLYIVRVGLGTLCCWLGLALSGGAASSYCWDKKNILKMIYFTTLPADWIF
jgi:hypothetical protein